MARGASLLLIVCLAGCDASPNSPSPSGPPPPVTGTWTGTLTSANLAPQTIVLQLQQVGHSVTGSYRLSPRADFTGVVSNGMVDSQGFTGLLFLSAGAGCQSHGDFAGSVSSSELRWTSSGFSSPVPCLIGTAGKDLPRNVTIQVTR